MNFDQTVGSILEQQYNDSWPTRMLNKAWGMVGHPGLPAHYQKAKEAGMIETDPDGRVRIKPEFYNKPSSSPSPTPTAAPTQSTQSTQPTQIDPNQVATIMNDIDRAVQQQAQSDPGFDADLYARTMRDQVQQEVDALVKAGLDKTYIENAIKRNVADKVKMIPKYASQYRKPADQQNVTGGTPQQSYTSGYMSPVMSATKSQAPNAIAHHVKTGQWPSQVMSATKTY